MSESFFPGREFFVGLSEWTNEAGARAVAAAFPDFPCTPVKVRPCVDPDESLALDRIQVRGFLPTATIALDERLERRVSAERFVPTHRTAVTCLPSPLLLAQEKYVGGPEKFLKKLGAGAAVSVTVPHLMSH
jgi:hypothetical protein